MFKKYLGWQVKSLLPLGLILLVAMGTIFLSTCLQSTIFTANYVDPYYPDFYYYLFGRTTNLLELLIPAFIIANIFPFWVFNYRYSLVSVDTFYQAPFKEGTIKKTRLIICLVYLLVDFTVIFWFGYALLFTRQAITPLPSADEYRFYTLEPFHLDYCFYTYLVTLLCLSAQYFIASYFISRGNHFVNSFFLLLIGEVGLALIFSAPFTFLSTATNLISSNSHEMSGLTNLSLIMPISLIYQLFNNGILNGVSSFSLSFETTSDTIYSALTIGFIVLYLVIGIVGGLVCFFEKEPSGEYAGKPLCRDASQDIIFNVSFGLIGTALISLGSLILGGFISLIFWSLGYYLFSGLLNRDFRLRKRRLIIMFVMIGLLLLQMLIIPILEDINAIDITTM